MWLLSRNRLRAKNSPEAKKLKVRILNFPHHHQDSEVIYTWTHVKNAGNTCLICFAWFNKAIFLSKNWAIKIGFFSPADIFFEKKILIVAKKTSNNFCCAPKTSVRFIFGVFDFGQKEEGKHSIKVKGSNRYCGIFFLSPVCFWSEFSTRWYFSIFRTCQNFGIRKLFWKLYCKVAATHPNFLPLFSATVSFNLGGLFNK